MVRAAILVALTAAAQVLAGAPLASAAPCAGAPSLCRCRIDPDFAAMTRKRLTWADAVFRGTVVRLDTLAGRLRVTKDGTRAPLHVVARLRVSESWKGSPGDTATITLYNDLVPGPYWTNCATWLDRDRTYVVFAGRAADGTFVTDMCSGTVELQHAAATLEVLGSTRRAGAVPP